MDFSKWGTSHPFYSAPNVTSSEKAQLLADRDRNAKKLGFLSHEAPQAEIVTDACLLKSKSYVLKMFKLGDDDHLNGKENGEFRQKLVMKGAKISLLDLKHDYAVSFLLGNEKMNIVYRHVTIESRKHQLRIRTGPKIVCNRQFTKRFVLNGGIKSLAYGHYLIPIYQTIYDLLDKVEILVDN